MQLQHTPTPLPAVCPEGMVRLRLPAVRPEGTVRLRLHRAAPSTARERRSPAPVSPLSTVHCPLTVPGRCPTPLHVSRSASVRGSRRDGFLHFFPPTNVAANSIEVPINLAIVDNFCLQFVCHVFATPSMSHYPASQPPFSQFSCLCLLSALGLLPAL